MVVAIEGGLRRDEVRPLAAGLQQPQRDDGTACFLGIVDPAQAVEDRQAEGLAGALADLLPVALEEVAVALIDDMRAVGAQAAHDERELRAVLVLRSQLADHLREAVAPRTHRIADVDDFLVHVDGSEFPDRSFAASRRPAFSC
jgi:hypothetical protein